MESIFNDRDEDFDEILSKLPQELESRIKNLVSSVGYFLNQYKKGTLTDEDNSRKLSNIFRENREILNDLCDYIENDFSEEDDDFENDDFEDDDF